jgi:sortase A
MSRHRKQALLIAQYAFLFAGLVMIGYCAFVATQVRQYQKRAQDKMALWSTSPRVYVPDQTTAMVPEGRKDSPTPVESNEPPIIGGIEIARTHLSAIIAQGTSSEVLRLAVGHVAGTALPGETGNIALAAHRDSFFRGLGELQPGDLIRLIAPSGRFNYRVDFTEVVNPTDTWVLQPSSNQVLTLITCYPFHYVGAAPKRFIVRAFRVDAG